MKDDKLLSLLGSDPDAGMRQLLRQYSGLVYAIVRARLSECCDSSEIEDCVTDVFLAFRDRVGSFVPSASVKNYLAVLARNTAVKYLRRRVPTDPDPGDDGLLSIPDPTDFTEEIAERQLLAEIYAEIGRMGHPDSDILIRKYYFRQDAKRIAGDLGMTADSVNVRAFRAMEKLRAKFGGKK